MELFREYISTKYFLRRISNVFKTILTYQQCNTINHRLSIHHLQHQIHLFMILVIIHHLQFIFHHVHIQTNHIICHLNLVSLSLNKKGISFINMLILDGSYYSPTSYPMHEHSQSFISSTPVPLSNISLVPVTKVRLELFSTLVNENFS
jgi:hypothetical protein